MFPLYGLDVGPLVSVTYTHLIDGRHASVVFTSAGYRQRFAQRAVIGFVLGPHDHVAPEPVLMTGVGAYVVEFRVPICRRKLVVLRE